MFQCSLIIGTSGELAEVTVATSFLTRLLLKCLLPNKTTFCGTGSETSAEELGEKVAKPSQGEMTPWVFLGVFFFCFYIIFSTMES